MGIELSLTIPIYNEESSIRRTVTNLAKEFEKKKIDYELVLVNHGSIDNTEKVLRRLSKKNKRLKVINLDKNLGFGGGIMYGFEHSEGRHIGFTCADEEVSAEDTYKIYSVLRNDNYDVSKSIRLGRKDGIMRIITSRVFNFLISTRFNLHIKDVNGYPVFFKKDIYQEIKPKEKEYLFNLDFLKNMRKKKYKIIEIPVTHKERVSGKSFMKPSRIIEMVIQFLRYSIKLH